MRELWLAAIATSALLAGSFSAVEVADPATAAAASPPATATDQCSDTLSAQALEALEAFIDGSGSLDDLIENTTAEEAACIGVDYETLVAFACTDGRFDANAPPCVPAAAAFNGLSPAASDCDVSPQTAAALVAVFNETGTLDDLMTVATAEEFACLFDSPSSDAVSSTTIRSCALQDLAPATVAQLEKLEAGDIAFDEFLTLIDPADVACAVANTPECVQQGNCEAPVPSQAPTATDGAPSCPVTSRADLAPATQEVLKKLEAGAISFEEALSLADPADVGCLHALAAAERGEE